MLSKAVATAIIVLLLPSARAEAQLQPTKIARVGYLQIAPRDTQRHLIEAFERGLTERGYVVGRDVIVEYRFADGSPERLDALAEDLVRRDVAAIVTGVNANTRAAQKATRSIPIVMALSYFPVEDGLVSSLARPGGNVTGLTSDTADEVARRLQILREIAPRVSRVAVLASSRLDYQAPMLAKLDAAARNVGIVVVPVELGGAADVEQTFGEVARAKANGLIVLGGPIALANRDRIVELSARAKLPAVWFDRQIVLDGALAAYGVDVADQYRRAAGYVDRILRGAKPADLPIEQPAKYVLALNAKTAKVLGLTLPRSLLLQADLVVD